MPLKIDYKDAIPPVTGRVYRPTYNADNTMTLEDVTEYEQVGDAFGAADVNGTNTKINELDASHLKYVKATVSKTAAAAGQVSISAAASTFVPAGSTVVDVSAQVAAGSDTAKISSIFVYNNVPVATFVSAATLSFVITVLYI